MKKLLYAIGSILFLYLLGCEGILYYYQYPKSQYRELNMSAVSIGMTEQQVREILGEPADVIGSHVYEDNRIIRVLQYLEAELGFAVDRLNKNYYLYFLDGRLVQWGRPGDWQKEADKIYEIRIR